MTTLHAWLEFADVQTGSPRRVDLDHDTLTIGRTGGDLRLIDEALAEVHAIVSRELGAYVIRDLSGGVGTFVNDRAVVEAQLTNLDRVRVGRTVMTFHAAYLDPEAYALRYGRARQPEEHEADTPAPGHVEGSSPPDRRKTIWPFRMLTHPLRFWPDALETGVLQLRRTWLTHLLNVSLLVACALWTTDGVPFLHLGFLTFAATCSLVAVAMTCSVFFAFDSLRDAPHRLGQALRFTFHLTPFVLAAQSAFLAWAWHTHPHAEVYFLMATLPTMAFWSCFALQSRHAFGVGLARGLAFALTASVPWNLLMTGLMSFIV